MKPAKTQTRGNCQCCGRDQAVLASGRMSKHGYTVENHWFNGVCGGDRYEPMQIKRDITDMIIGQVRAQVVDLLKRAADLKAGKVFPTTAGSNKLDPAKPGNYLHVPFAEAAPHHQRDAIESAIWRAEMRARSGTSFADDMTRLVNEVHGQPLSIVEVAAGPAPIIGGEKRVSAGVVLTATRQEAGRVYWKNDAGRRSWMGTQSWRHLPMST